MKFLLILLIGSLAHEMLHADTPTVPFLYKSGDTEEKIVQIDPDGVCIESTIAGGNPVKIVQKYLIEKLDPKLLAKCGLTQKEAEAYRDSLRASRRSIIGLGSTAAVFHNAYGTPDAIGWTKMNQIPVAGGITLIIKSRQVRMETYRLPNCTLTTYYDQNNEAPFLIQYDLGVLSSPLKVTYPVRSEALLNTFLIPNKAESDWKFESKETMVSSSTKGDHLAAIFSLKEELRQIGVQDCAQTDKMAH